MTMIATQAIYAEGDQFLDGIGETALIARYVFDGKLDDWSRNGLHAKIERGLPRFVEDDQFGSVLALPGGRNGPVAGLPGSLLQGCGSFSFTGWFKADPTDPDQCFLFVGDRSRYFGFVLSGREDGNRRLGAMLLENGRTLGESASFSGGEGQWMHLSLVLDAANGQCSIYVDGKRFLDNDALPEALKELLDASDVKPGKLTIGGVAFGGEKACRGKLHDIRFYRIALTERQVAVIHHNAISDDQWGAENAAGDSAEDYHADHARQLVANLAGVEDIQVETVVGQLPRLPYYLDGVYRDGARGPKVRVIWPAPKDADLVRKAGRYSITGEVPGTNFKPSATVLVTDARPSAPPRDPVLESFSLEQVLLTPYSDGSPTPFMKHRDKFIEGLAKTNPDRFLYAFRDAFGEKQPADAEPLGVWDSPTCRLRGHATGHYLSAIAHAYASAAYDHGLQAQFGKKIETMVDVLYELAQQSGKAKRPGGEHKADPANVPPGPGRDDYDSDLSKDGIRTDYWNWGEGFISAYPPDQFIMLEQGASYGTGNNQIWAPYYTLHKIMAGLMDCYELGGNPKALEVAKGMGLWVYKRLSQLPPEARIKMWNSYIAGEYGGMNEAMARLGRLTGDDRFLECAKLFDNTEFFFGDADHGGGLVRNIDTLRGKHANQHIPQITGALETYRDTQNAAYYRVAMNFWDICTHSYMYSIGGVAGARNPNNAECFTAEPDTLFRNGLADGGQNETCATYNLLKLGRRMFMYDPEAGYMDYYERALYNDILASVAEHNAGNTYHIPLNPGAIKGFSNAKMDGFTCCNGTALESATKLQNTIYFKSTDGDALYVNLYVPSKLAWKERGVALSQETYYPYADESRLTVQGGGAFTLNLRVPGWASQDVRVWVNDEEQTVDASPGSYLALKRNWIDGDVVRIRIPMDFHLMPLMDQPNIASIFYGPVLLAAEESGVRTDWRAIHLDPDHPGLSFRGDPSVLRFEADGAHFKPFFETYGHHSVYLDIVPEEKAANDPSIGVIDPSAFRLPVGE